MRIIGTIHDENQARQFSAFLKTEGIEHQLDVASNKDWGSEDYGTSRTEVWVINEDRFEEAQEWLKQFNADPTDPLFLPKVDVLSKASPNTFGTKITPIKEAELKKIKLPITPKKQKESGVITYFILGLCILLFLLSEATQPVIPYSQINKVFYAPLSITPVNRPLMYDHPAAFDSLDKVVALYGIPALEDPNTLPLPGKFLLQQYLETPYWQGIYDQVIVHIKKPDAAWNFTAPLFEKIREGEVWRLVTPILLHYDILHIFFNMAWLLMLGKQIESRIKGIRYILLILIAGIVSNTAQYLMSGSNFIGFSGVVCAMIAFIWARQRHAAWEGYLLQRSTLIFVSVFIVSIIALQFISFLGELSGIASFTPGIANTAHVVGALVGYALGRLPAFAWKT